MLDAGIARRQEEDMVKISGDIIKIQMRFDSLRLSTKKKIKRGHSINCICSGQSRVGFQMTLQVKQWKKVVDGVSVCYICQKGWCGYEATLRETVSRMRVVIGCPTCSLSDCAQMWHIPINANMFRGKQKHSEGTWSSGENSWKLYLTYRREATGFWNAVFRYLKLAITWKLTNAL